MPTIDCVSPDLPDRGVRRALLAEAGPTIPVQIGHDPGFDEYADLKPVVPPDLYPALVDTGASGNSIDNELAVALGLPVVEYAVTVSGSVGEHTTNVYLAHIHIAELSRTIAGRFTGVALAAGGQLHRAIIGRSFLQDFVLHYDGRTGLVTLSDD